MEIKSVSDFKIMKSPAGYYIGKDCQVVYGDETITEPYDRFTDYYPTKKPLEKMLKAINKNYEKQ